MTSDMFFPFHRQVKTSRQWQASNRALGRLIARNRFRLANAIAIAKGIQCRLESVFPQLDKLVRRTCPWCPEPCCIVNKVWYDFADLLFLHLSRQLIPPAPLNADPWKACLYLSNKGCALPRMLRPWACTLYICPTQCKILSRHDRSGRMRIESMIQTIKVMRLDMEDAFVTTIAQKGGSNGTD